MNPDTIVVFRSQLGWMGLIAAGPAVRQFTFGHPTAAAAKAALKNAQQCLPVQEPEPSTPRKMVPGGAIRPAPHPSIKTLVHRLQAFALGQSDDFRDVHIELGPLSEFQRRVLRRCRQIPYGHTISYAKLAAQAGCPGAARAAGNCMAANRIPLMIPCHRVVRSDGQPGAYSAPGGSRTKRRLLALEAKNSGN
jgi:methylated-DNA-[protein]-cysteine S-methyltransferase